MIGSNWWGEEDICLTIIKADNKENAYRQFIIQHYQNVFGDNAIWNEEIEPVEDCLLHMEVTCSIIEVP